MRSDDIIIIGFDVKKQSWFLYRRESGKWEELHGPYDSHEEAAIALGIMAHRLAQGWEP